MVASKLPDEFLNRRLEATPEVLGNISTDNKVVFCNTLKNVSQLTVCVPIVPPSAVGVAGPTFPVELPKVAAT